MVKRLALGMLTAAASTVTGSFPASAATTFADNFNQANNGTLQHGWGELEATPSSVRIDSNQLVLGDQSVGIPDAAAGLFLQSAAAISKFAWAT